ncbi:MAG: DUF3662 domain-containing protein [Chamaesiphon sp. CSU_1_12]|nr:DUF3662 domain-containing protein [Chamaesiphon sp. CSU_1_12]
MGLARKLEHRLEQLVDGLSAAIFRGGIHPVDLAGRVVRQADLSAFEGELGQEIPNDYTPPHASRRPRRDDRHRRPGLDRAARIQSARH